MIRFKRLRFKNAVTYGSTVDIPLENQGRVFLSGHNQDTGASNGAGKSTIWEVLQHVLFATTSKGYSRNKFAGQGYKAQLDLEVDGHEYTITQFRGIKNEERTDGYTILKDGVDVTPKGTRHQQDCINLIKETIGITEAEFRGYIYLAQEGPGHVLISGKGADKRDYLSDLFTLDRYDAVKDGVDAELAIINANISELSEKIAVRDELRSQIASNTFDREDFKEYFVSLKGTRDFLQAKAEHWSNKHLEFSVALGKTEERQALESTLDGIYPQWKELDVPEEIRKRETKLRAMASRLEHMEKLSEVKTERKELGEAYIEDLGTNEAEAVEALNKLQAKVTLTEDKIKKIKRRLVLEDQLPNLAGVSEDLNDRLKKSGEELARMTSLVKEAKKTLETSKNLLGTACPTCGQSLDQEAIKKTRERAKIIVASLTPAIENEAVVTESLQKLVAKATEHAKIRAQISELPTGTMEDKSAQIDGFKEEIEGLKTLVSKARENARISKRLGALAEIMSRFPDDLDDSDLEDHRIRVEKLEKQIVKLKQLQTLKVGMEAMPEIEPVTPEEFSYAKEMAEYFKKARTDLSTHIAAAKHMKESFDGVSERLAELESQLSVWEGVQRRKTLFEAMKVAYGPKGLKIQQLKKVCNAICQTLPKYTTIMFQEPRIEFFVDNDPDSVEIEFYIRRFAKDGMVEEYPVGKLSGGEKKRLAVAFIFSLSDLVAPRKKANLIILDEVGDGLDGAGEYAFASQLLPQLAQESVVVTSHRPGIEAAQYDTKWLVTKVENKSTFAVSKGTV